MITSSFCFLPGIGVLTERQWWHEGLTSWDAFLSATQVRGISVTRKTHFDNELNMAREYLCQEDARYFAIHLASQYQWRLYEWLCPQAVYLDIETNAYNQLTVVGLYAQQAYTSLIRENHSHGDDWQMN